MGFFKNLFEKGEDPVRTFEDPTLGHMEWSKDDDAWIGTYNGFRFALSYARKATPTPRVLAYAKDVLGDAGWLASTLEVEKKVWLSNVPPSGKEEVAGLKFGLVHFSFRREFRRETGYIIADVEGGGDNRSWRIEYHDRKCDGLGFDT
jgi:hypothetical protein